MVPPEQLDEEVQKWCDEILEKSPIALTEPHGGSDAANLRLKAENKGDVYVLNGEKTSISMADQADVAVVFARTGTVEQRASGISAFLVPMDSPGITTTRFEDNGQRAIGRARLVKLTDSGRVFWNNLQDTIAEFYQQALQGMTAISLNSGKPWTSGPG